MSSVRPSPPPPEVPRSHMLLTLGALLCMGFFLTTTISYLVSRETIRETILHDELPLSSDNIYSEIQRDLFEPILISSLMANDTFVKDWIVNGEEDEVLIRSYLAQIQERFGTVTSFLVSDATLRYYHPEGVLKTVDVNNPADQWFFRVRTMLPEYEINVDPDMANKEAMTIFINYRITDTTGKFLGATGVGLTVNAVKSLMEDYRKRYHRDIYFYTRAGELILHSLEDHTKGDPLPPHLDKKTLENINARIGGGTGEISFSANTPDGSMANYRYIPELDWILIVEQKSDRTWGILFQSFALNLIVCLVTAVILLNIIRITVLRYQGKLEARNQQLHDTNNQIQQQAAELETVNDQLDALHKEKDEFIGMIVHDLKDPLNSVIGLSELLVDRPSMDSDSQEYVKFIQTSAGSMLEQVEDLLRLTELESPTEVKLSEVDASEMVRRAIDCYQFHARAKSTPLHVNLPVQKVFVHAQETWLVSAIGNLVSNAIKYSPAGQPIAVSLVVDPEVVEISVKDEGEGISSDEVPRLFQKFERLSPRPTAGENSTGLGLYIVGQMLTRMGGNVRCESERGAGSKFTISLPRVTSRH